MLAKEEGFYKIAKDILRNSSQLFVSRPYIAIIDRTAEVHYIDDFYPLEQYKKFLRHFIRENYSLLRIGDHSMPLGGTNLGIFRLSDKAFVILYLEKGPSGQLLSFKARMNEWAQDIDNLIGDISIDPLEELKKSIESVEKEELKPTNVVFKRDIEGKGFKEIPFLVKKLSGKEKFGDEEARVVGLCDGVHSVEDICNEIKIPKIKVKEIIKQYQKKNWVEMKRLII